MFLGDQGVCYLSKYDTSFETEQLFALRTDGRCYDNLRVFRFPKSNRLFVFLLNQSEETLNTFYLDLAKNQFEYSSPVTQSNI